MWGRLRFRPLQALVLLALSALVAVVACLGPLFQRATEQAVARDLLERATPSSRAVAISSVGPGALPPERLTGRLPAQVEPYVGNPVGTSRVRVTAQVGSLTRPAGNLVSSDGVCAHLLLEAGRCPVGAGEVAVTAADRSRYGADVGDTVSVTEAFGPTDYVSGPPGRDRLTVVGVFDTAADDAYPALPRTGGTVTIDGDTVTDDWVVTDATLAGADAPRWLAPKYTVAWPVDASDIDVEGLARLGAAITAWSAAEQDRNDPYGTRNNVDSDLPQLADQSQASGSQGRTTVTAFMLQLLVLALVVTWLTVGAAVEQRRPEVALALLRGRGTRGAARLLLAELLGVTVAGVVVGGAAALGVADLLARMILPVPTPIEPRGPYLLAWLGAVAVVVAIVLLATRLAVREPVSSLLRRVAARGGGRSSGIAEAVVVAGCVTAVAAFLTGNLRGPLAVVSPTLLALAAGIVVARLAAPAAGRAGEALLARGRVVVGVGLLQVARRSDVRRVIVVTTVATALLVFSLDAVTTGARNRGYAAEQVNGAPVVLSLSSTTVGDVLAAVDAVDPERRHLTVVTRLAPVGDSAAAVIGVEPRAFPRIALFPGQDTGAVDWRAVLAPTAVPVDLTAAALRGSLAVAGVTTSGPAAGSQDPAVTLLFDRPDGQADSVELGPLTRRSAPRRFAVDLPCEDGCVVTGLAVTTSAGLVAQGSFVLRDLTTPSGTAVDLGPAATWTATGGRHEGRLQAFDPAAADPGGLGGRFVTTGESPTVMVQDWLPARVPAIATDGQGSTILAPGLDGEDQPMTVVGHVPRVPSAGARARIVDLTDLVRQGAAPAPDLRVEVWSDSTDPGPSGPLARVTDALRARQVEVTGSSSLTSVRAALDRGPPTWSLTLGALAAAMALLVAALVLAVVASATWRQRARDLAALRMTGVDRRTVRGISLVEQLAAVVGGVLLGTACGVVGSHYALPSVRFFATAPEVSTLDVSTPWPLVGLVAGGALLLLGAVAGVSALLLVRRARLATVREVL